MGASGQWLAQPTAALKATGKDGSHVSALLSLAEPRYNATRKTLAFKARLSALLLRPQTCQSVPHTRRVWLGLTPTPCLPASFPPKPTICMCHHGVLRV